MHKLAVVTLHRCEDCTSLLCQHDECDQEHMTFLDASCIYIKCQTMLNLFQNAICALTDRRYTNEMYKKEAISEHVHCGSCPRYVCRSCLATRHATVAAVDRRNAAGRISGQLGQRHK